MQQPGDENLAWHIWQAWHALIKLLGDILADLKDAAAMQCKQHACLCALMVCVD